MILVRENIFSNFKQAKEKPKVFHHQQHLSIHDSVMKAAFNAENYNYCAGLVEWNCTLIKQIQFIVENFSCNVVFISVDSAVTQHYFYEVNKSLNMIDNKRVRWVFIVTHLCRWLQSFRSLIQELKPQM